ncbi:acyltransferase family protein [Psychroserpens luteolus]|uniref:acyltransferase family protein n=1 Tax=Psychroserpens luteolus TaxID=2855840 RepID=UPI001E56B6B7|nr:acyltransferase [Psychroserpens luteolus]MCD2259791.1 acyltransferase [Psychroserpens luteolus]
MIGKKKIFFNGLNELRAIAAFGVIVHHLEQFKKLDGIKIFDTPFHYLVHSLGKSSVHLFFVLSGFLITYLLFQEKQNNGKIHIKKFYLRRIYRIWPLYYLIMFIGFIVIPYISNFDIFENVANLCRVIENADNYSATNIALYLGFLPQFAKPVLGVAQSWSIGIEEQFYLFIPLALHLLTKKWFLRLLIVTLICYSVATFFVHDYLSYKTIVYKIFKFFKIQYLTIGAIGGYLYFFHSEMIKKWTSSKYIYTILIVLICYLMAVPVVGLKIQEFILAIGYMILILMTINSANTLALRNKSLAYLGKISYGIYMYHPFMIFLVMPVVNKYVENHVEGGVFYNLMLYIFTYMLTIIVSILSYRFIESKFIMIKDTKFKTI